MFVPTLLLRRVAGREVEGLLQGGLRRHVSGMTGKGGGSRHRALARCGGREMFADARTRRRVADGGKEVEAFNHGCADRAPGVDLVLLTGCPRVLAHAASAGGHPVRPSSSAIGGRIFLRLKLGVVTPRLIRGERKTAPDRGGIGPWRTRPLPRWVASTSPGKCQGNSGRRLAKVWTRGKGLLKIAYLTVAGADHALCASLRSAHPMSARPPVPPPSGRGRGHGVSMHLVVATGHPASDLSLRFLYRSCCPRRPRPPIGRMHMGTAERPQSPTPARRGAARCMNPHPSSPGAARQRGRPWHSNGPRTPPLAASSEGEGSRSRPIELSTVESSQVTAHVEREIKASGKGCARSAFICRDRSSSRQIRAVADPGHGACLRRPVRRPERRRDPPAVDRDAALCGVDAPALGGDP